ncbi:MAG TPA: D-glucuronyl C5-epimerase family protein [Solirubrobacteraceae bacterium]|nr:D-glucuronyl C5-epimerase family protein [Solirubrobacteraceae bacterium]
MRRIAVAVLALLALPSSAAAAPVLVLGHDGRAVPVNDPYLHGPALTPAPALAPAMAPSAARARSAARPGSRPARARPRAHVALARGRMHARRAPQRPERTVTSELARLQRTGQITPAAYALYRGAFTQALATERRLRGTRRAELTAITETLHGIAASGQLTASRLPALFTTLARNVQWWTHGPLLAPDQRVEFTGSQLVWEYYPGQGIQLQVLGTFGRANGLFGSGPGSYPALQQLMAEMIPLAAQRGGRLAWEYYFNFDGGRPPWTSAMSQATGLQALSHAYLATEDAGYLSVADRALALFGAGPPVGVGVAAPNGTRFLQYTFAPGVSIINAFLQTLIGLDTYAQVSGDPRAQQLFAAGNAEAMAEVPRFDTGAWSLYQPGIEDTLSYHQLVTGFLSQLCTLTSAPVYCTTAQHFTADETTPPVLTQLTGRGRVKRTTQLRFRLSKVSHVGITVTQGARTVLLTSASFGYGVHSFTVPVISRPGIYSVLLTATDLAGNTSRITGRLQITR